MSDFAETPLPPHDPHKHCITPPVRYAVHDALNKCALTGNSQESIVELHQALAGHLFLDNIYYAGVAHGMKASLETFEAGVKLRMKERAG